MYPSAKRQNKIATHFKHGSKIYLNPTSAKLCLVKQK